MSIDVETPFLRGYADLIEADCDSALRSMAEYVQVHCNDFEGLDGTLTPLQPALRSLAEATADLITAAQGGLRQTAADLRRSADDYDRADWTAAETQWSVAPQWSTPQAWRETDVVTKTTSGGYGYGAVVALMAPLYTPEVGEAQDNLKTLFGTVNTIIEKLTGYDLLGAVMPLLLGDWAALKRIARRLRRARDRLAYRRRRPRPGHERPVPALDLGGVTGASDAFDYHIRSRWMTAFEALAQRADTIEQMCESMAAQHEHTVKGLLYTLTFYMARISKGLNKIMVATNWAKLATALYGSSPRSTTWSWTGSSWPWSRWRCSSRASRWPRPVTSWCATR